MFSIANNMKLFVRIAVAGMGLLLANGCATVTAFTESALNKPSISDTVDSFESAALAIKISNRILLHAPISEEETWPEKLYHAPSITNSIKMAMAGLGSYYNVTIPTEFDSETGFPRPTSPLYIMIKDRNQMLDKELNNQYLIYFKQNPNDITCSIVNKQPDCVNEFAYRNPLMAYGTITGNSLELVRLEQKVDLMSQGYRECDAWVRKSKEGDVVPVACKDMGLREDEVERSMQINLTKEELETAKKNYGRLSKRIYQASVAGADFTAAAVTKISIAIIKFPRAVKNAEEEFSGWKGAINTAMILPRLKNLFSAIDIYKAQLGTQFTAYKTMYKQLNQKYDTTDDEKTREAKARVERFSVAYAKLAPKLEIVARGGNVAFSTQEAQQWESLAASYPPQEEMAAMFTASLQQ